MYVPEVSKLNVHGVGIVSPSMFKGSSTPRHVPFMSKRRTVLSKEEDRIVSFSDQRCDKRRGYEVKRRECIRRGYEGKRRGLERRAKARRG